MCGIAGIIAPRMGPADEGRLRRMADTMVHRGPDEAGLALFPNAGLSFRRLSIIDVDGSHQPLSNEDKTVSLMCNGEIYNYMELRDRLSQLGHTFQSDGDAEVAVHAYEEWGIDFVRHLRGMFAIAIWDSKRETCILARDRVGIKPLFYTETKGEFVFGSELKAVLASEKVDRDIDSVSLDLYLTLGYIPSPRTIYKGINKLQPGHVLVFNKGNARVHPYWSPYDTPTLSLTDTHECTERLTAHLKESVKLHLQSDVPVAFFLSGGLDSSALVALAARELGITPTTFSMGFETTSHNELHFARQVADRYGCQHREEYVTADAAAVLPAVVGSFDEPFADSSAIPTYYISRMASQEVKVVLGGDGGDELFVGYDWTRRHRYIERWARCPRWMRNMLHSAAAPYRDCPGTAGQISRFLDDAHTAPLDGYLRRMSTFNTQHKHDMYTGGLKDEIERQHARNLFYACGRFEERRAIESMNLVDFGIYLPDDDLCKVDRMTMLHSLEGRVPFLDHHVVEFALSLPLDLKLKGTTTKHLLKCAVKDILPQDILRQRKQGFSVPISKWMRDDLYETAHRMLASGKIRNRELLHWEGVSNMLQAHRQGVQDHGHRIWNLLVLEVWLRMSEQPAQGLSSISLEDLD